MEAITREVKRLKKGKVSKGWAYLSYQVLGGEVQPRDVPWSRGAAGDTIPST